MANRVLPSAASGAEAAFEFISTNNDASDRTESLNDRESPTATANDALSSGNGINHVECQEPSAIHNIQNASKKLEDAIRLRDLEYQTHLNQLDRAEKRIVERFQSLESKRASIYEAYGNTNASPDDLMEINAGGKIIAAKRSTLTQIKGTRLEALFSGRWEKKLQRDKAGRIFIDVNPKGFQAIVDYLNDMKISPDDNPPDPPSVNDEYYHILVQQVKIFGIADTLSIGNGIPGSSIIQTDKYANIIHNWLREDGSDGKFELLYSSSRDGFGFSVGFHAGIFHSKCDNMGSTITIIETNQFHVVGGYSNSPWSLGATPPGTFAPPNARWSASNRAFLFAMSNAFEANVATKMKLKNPSNNHAILTHSSKGPTFGMRSTTSPRVRRSSSRTSSGDNPFGNPTGPFQDPPQLRHMTSLLMQTRHTSILEGLTR